MEGVFAALASVFAAIVGRARVSSRPDRTRKRLTANIEAWITMSQHAELAEGAAHLRDLIGEQALYLGEIERKIIERKFDTTQPFLALLVGAPTAWGAYLAWEQGGGWWRALAVVAAMLAAVFAFVGIQGFFTPARVDSGEPTNEVTDQDFPAR